MPSFSYSGNAQVEFDDEFKWQKYNRASIEIAIRLCGYRIERVSTKRTTSYYYLTDLSLSPKNVQVVVQVEFCQTIFLKDDGIIDDGLRKKLSNRSIRLLSASKKNTV